jgi:hypothetical protein
MFKGENKNCYESWTSKPILDSHVFAEMRQKRETSASNTTKVAMVIYVYVFMNL